MMASRAWRIAAVLTCLAGIALSAFGKIVDALVLTLTVAVGMINALWLERLLVGVLQPGRPRFSFPAVVLLVGRMSLWGLLFGVLYLMRGRFELWTVALGVGFLLAALAAAAWRAPE
jgi:hypothetical protein